MSQFLWTFFMVSAEVIGKVFFLVGGILFLTGSTRWFRALMLYGATRHEEKITFWIMLASTIFIISGGLIVLALDV